MGLVAASKKRVFEETGQIIFDQWPICLERDWRCPAGNLVYLHATSLLLLSHT